MNDIVVNFLLKRKKELHNSEIYFFLSEIFDILIKYRKIEINNNGIVCSKKLRNALYCEHESDEIIKKADMRLREMKESDLIDFNYAAKLAGWDKDIFFNISGDWIMSLTSEGKIRFNRDRFPDLTEDEFAEVVASRLEEIRLTDLRKNYVRI